MQNPKLIPVPFANSGIKDDIPKVKSTSMSDEKASWEAGFPEATMLPVYAGGLPPDGKDFNGVLNQISENLVFQSKGGRYKFDSDFAISIGGYPKGATLQTNDESAEYQSLIDNNLVNFNTATPEEIAQAWRITGLGDAIEVLNGKFDKTSVKNELGLSKTEVVSQKVVTELGSGIVGSFENGLNFIGELTNSDQQVTLENEFGKQPYYWDGDFPKQVPADSTPQSTGGIGKGAWVSVGDASLRGELPSIVGDITNYQSSSVHDMVQGRTVAKNKITIAVGQIWSSGGTKWRVVDESSPISIGNFRAFNCINVLDFGAKGDGVTDDTDAIQSAVNSLSGDSRGGVVYLPRGTYIISKSININRESGDGTYYPLVPAMNLDNISFIGEAKGGDYTHQDWGTTIKQVNSTENGLWFFKFTTGGKVKNIQVTGARCGVKFDNCLFFELSSCSLSRNEYGCEVWGNGVGNIQNNKIRENYKFGLALYASSGDTLVQGNDIGRQGYGKSGSYQSANVYISSGGIRLINNLIFT
ncbi:glycosyl hydrolase family 28-related protein, partial [Providencia rettgeri]